MIFFMSLTWIGTTVDFDNRWQQQKKQRRFFSPHLRHLVFLLSDLVVNGSNFNEFNARYDFIMPQSILLCRHWLRKNTIFRWTCRLGNKRSMIIHFKIQGTSLIETFLFLFFFLFFIVSQNQSDNKLFRLFFHLINHKKKIIKMYHIEWNYKFLLWISN